MRWNGQIVSRRWLTAESSAEGKGAGVTPKVSERVSTFHPKPRQKRKGALVSERALHFDGDKPN
ncbi:MAG: hypothetical protein ACR2NX_08445, partial [Chthoniobacterales bacterium]